MTKIPTRFLSPFFFFGRWLSLHEGNAAPEAAVCTARRPQALQASRATAHSPGAHTAQRHARALSPAPQSWGRSQSETDNQRTQAKPSLSQAPLQASQVKTSLLQSHFSFRFHLVMPFCSSKPGSSYPTSPPQSDRRVSMETTKVTF